jgi:hypothetical protein
MKEISLVNGGVTLVDDADYEWLSAFSWRAVRAWSRGKRSHRVYAWRYPKLDQRSMHRLITKAPKGKEVDHRDGDGLNNQRHNLRVCTTRQNSANKPGIARRTTLYKGVHRKGNRYRARIKVNGRDVFGGSYRTQEEAARARDQLAIQHFGEFAWLNFPEAASA